MENKRIVIEYNEKMKNDESHDGLVVWLEDMDTGEKDFVCSNIFRKTEGQESEEANAMHFGLFKEAIQWHMIHGYPIIWK